MRSDSVHCTVAVTNRVAMDTMEILKSKPVAADKVLGAVTKFVARQSEKQEMADSAQISYNYARVPDDIMYQLRLVVANLNGGDTASTDMVE